MRSKNVQATGTRKQAAEDCFRLDSDAVASRPAARPRRGQWGRDRRTEPMPVVPAPVSDRRIAMARLAIIITVTAWVGYLITWLINDFLNPLYSSAIDRLESVVYLFVVTMLTASAMAYLLSR